MEGRFPYHRSVVTYITFRKSETEKSTISMDKKLDTYGTKCYVGVSTWLHVLAVISQLRHFRA